MSTSSTLLAAPPLLLAHLTSMLGATVLGAVMLWRRKGTHSHKQLGWLWVCLMSLAALTSVFIADEDDRFLGISRLSPIHVLTALTAVMLVLAITAIRRRKVQRHRWTMINLYIGACLVAGAFTLLPGRFLGRLLWG